MTTAQADIITARQAMFQSWLNVPYHLTHWLIWAEFVALLADWEDGE